METEREKKSKGGRGRQGSLQSPPKAGIPAVRCGTQASRDSLAPERGIIYTHSDEAPPARALTAEDDAIPICF
jgi:hypothetical protein